MEKTNFPLLQLNHDVNYSWTILTTFVLLFISVDILYLLNSGISKFITFSFIVKSQEEVKTILTERYDANEIHSYVWYDNDFCREVGINPDSKLAIINSEDGYSARLRTTMYPTLLKCANINAKNFDNFMCYEIGSVYGIDNNKHSDEKLKLGLVLANRNKSNEELFYEAKDVISNVVLRTRGVEVTIDSVVVKPPGFEITISDIVRI